MPKNEGSTRLDYEALAACHATELSDALTDPRVYSYITGPRPATTADLVSLFTRRAAGPVDQAEGEVWWNFAVRLRGREFIGRIESTFHDGLVEVAYLFGPLFWGHGYATEALLWLHFRKRETGFAGSCWATVLPENTPSIRLLERLGYIEVTSGWPRLHSYDPGDRVYRAELLKLNIDASSQKTVK